MNNGYIKTHRKMLDNPVVMKSTDHLAVWMFLLLNATHKGYDVFIEKKRVTLKPGQFVTGRKIISKKLKINESKVERILKTFKIEQQIEQQTNPRCRIISILNWAEYQIGEQQTDQQVTNKQPLNKNDKNEKNIYSDQFEEFWKIYPRKIGRKKAIPIFQRSLKDTSFENIINGLNKHLVLWKDTEAQFIPHPTTWLNGERWDDEVVLPNKKIEVKKINKYVCDKCEKLIEVEKLSVRDVSCDCGGMFVDEYIYKHEKASKVPREQKKQIRLPSEQKEFNNNFDKLLTNLTMGE